MSKFLLISNSLKIKILFFFLLIFYDTIHATALQFSRSGCPCVSICEQHSARPQPSCSVNLDSCSGHSTILIESDSFIQSSSNTSDDNALDILTRPTYEKQTLKPVLRPEQINSVYDILDAITTIIKYSATVTSANKRRLLAKPNNSNNCSCKEDIFGIFDFCTLQTAENQTTSNDANISQQTEKKSIEPSTPLNQLTLPDNVTRLWNDSSSLLITGEHKQITSIGCDISCRTCLSWHKNSHTGCVQCNDTNTQKHLFLPYDSQSLHGTCFPINTSRSYCHSSCLSCLSNDKPLNHLTCMSCYPDSVLIPSPIGQCVKLSAGSSHNYMPIDLKSQNTRQAINTVKQKTLTTRKHTNYTYDAHNNASTNNSRKHSYSLRQWTETSPDHHKPWITTSTSTATIINMRTSTFPSHNDISTSTTTWPLESKPRISLKTTLNDEHQGNNSVVLRQQRRSIYWKPSQTVPIRETFVVNNKTREASEIKNEQLNNFVVHEKNFEYCNAIENFLKKSLIEDVKDNKSKWRLGRRYWTQLVYLQADNNLEKSAFANLREMLHPVDVNDNTDKTNNSLASDFLHLVVLLDTRGRNMSTEQEVYITTWIDSENRQIQKNESKWILKPLISKLFPMLQSKWDSDVYEFLKNIVVCPDLSIVDSVRHHNLSTEKGEAYELYRIRHYDVPTKQFTNAFKWLLLRRRGEVDMDDPLILSDFVSRSLQVFPSVYTSIFFWNHGGSWHGLGADQGNSDGKGMSLHDIAHGLSRGLTHASLTHLHYKFTLLGFDACAMSEYTVLDVLSDFCEFFLASQANEPVRGWNWRYLLPALRDETKSGGFRAARPLEYSSYIIKGYLLTFSQSLASVKLFPQSASTLSLIEMTRFYNFREHLKFVTKLLYACGGYRISSIIQSVLEQLPLLEACLLQNMCGCVDMGTFLIRLVERLLLEGFNRQFVSEVLTLRDLYHEMIVVDLTKEGLNVFQLNSHAHLNSRAQIIQERLMTGVSLYFPMKNKNCNKETNTDAMYQMYQSLFQTAWNQLLHKIMKKTLGKECTAHPSSRISTHDLFSASYSFFHDAQISSIQISVNKSNIVPFKEIIQFSSFISGTSLYIKTVVGVLLKKLPEHWAPVLSTTQEVVLLTRETSHLQDEKEFFFKIEDTWDLRHYVLTQSLSKSTNERGPKKATHDSKVYSPLYVRFVAFLKVQSIDTSTQQNVTQTPTKLFKNVYLAAIKYYPSTYHVQNDKYQYGSLLFQQPYTWQTLRLVLKKKKNWVLKPFSTQESFVKPILYFTKKSKSSPYVTYRPTDSPFLFTLQPHTLSIQLMDHTTFLQRNIFLYTNDNGLSTGHQYRAIVGFSIQNKKTVPPRLFLISLPDVQKEGYPFCIASYSFPVIDSKSSDNGVCDALLGRSQCETYRNKPFDSEDNRTNFSNLHVSEKNDCWTRNAQQLMLPLLFDMQHFSPHLFAKTLQMKTTKCDSCGNHTVCNWNSHNSPTSSSYTCECAKGYKPLKLSTTHKEDSVSQLHCVDVNECLELPLNETCPYPSACVNLPGTYACLCTTGYTTNESIQCVEELACQTKNIFEQCVCQPGFQPKEWSGLKNISNEEFENSVVYRAKRYSSFDTSTYLPQLKTTFLKTPVNNHVSHPFFCDDIDECSSNTSSCHLFAKCHNLKGGYACFCIDGYEGNGYECFPGSPSVTVQLNFVLPYQHSLQNFKHRTLSQIFSQLPLPFTTSYSLFSDNSSVNLQQILTTGLSKGLYISKWRINVTNCSTLTHPTSASDDLEASHHYLIAQRHYGMAYKCIVRIEALPTPMFSLHKVPFLFHNSQNNGNKKWEPTSFEAASDLKRQLSSPSHLIDEGNQFSYENDRDLPLRNPHIVGPLFAYLSNFMILDAIHIEPPYSSDSHSNVTNGVQTLVTPLIKLSKKIQSCLAEDTNRVVLMSFLLVCFVWCTTYLALA